MDEIDPRKIQDVIRGVREGWGDTYAHYLGDDGRVHVTRVRQVELATCSNCESFDPCRCFDREAG